MWTSSLLVFNGRWSRFRFVAIPVDGIEVDKLSPGSFLWLGLGKNSLEKIELLNVNMGVLSD